MAYLVTGGTGYIGSYVVRDLLERGKEVVCLQRSGVTPVFREVVGERNIDKVKVIQGSVAEPVQLFELIHDYDVDHIAHLSFAMPPFSEQDPATALRVNCVGMNNILEAARIFRVKKVVWPSAGIALGRIRDFYAKPIGDDDALYMPISMYGATKALNEYMTKLYYDKFGVDTIGFRLQLTFGVGRWHGVFGEITDRFRKAALNIPVTIRGGAEPMGFLYVENASNMFVQALDAPTTKTRVFNLIDGSYTWGYVAELMCKINPQAKVTVEGKAGSADYSVPEVDTTGVRTELGYKPKYEFEASVRRVLNYFRQKEGLALFEG